MVSEPSTFTISMASSSNSMPTPTTLPSIAVQLNRDNFITWKARIQPLLTANRLWDIVDGTTSPPPPTIVTTSDDGRIEKSISNPAYESWLLRDQIALAWLLNNISDAMMVHVVGLPHARDIWLALERLYAIQSEARYSTLMIKFHALNKGSLSMEDYLQEAKRISDNLAAINRSVSPADLRHQILLGLGPEYEHLVSTLLTTGIAASFEELHGILLQHDTRLRLQTSRTHSAMGGIPPTANYVQKGSQ